MFTPKKGKAPLLKNLDVSTFPKGQITPAWISLVSTGLGTPIHLPVMVARGNKPGPVLGVTAAVHGNELNGLPVIQRLFKEIDPVNLHGTLVGILVVNVPGLLRGQRKFLDGVDLNHIMPGNEHGTESEVYAYRFVTRILGEFDYLVDLHTASSGRINSFYIRADMDNETTRQMALLQNPQIIVHNPPRDGTLRGAAGDLDIPAITLEIGDPFRFQKGMILNGLSGLHNVMAWLKMTQREIEKPEEEIVICQNSFWMYTDRGGILEVPVQLTQKLKEGARVATLKDIFGEMLKEYYTPEETVVIGKSVNPINQTGSRIVHLGHL